MDGGAGHGLGECLEVVAAQGELAEVDVEFDAHVGVGAARVDGGACAVWVLAVKQGRLSRALADTVAPALEGNRSGRQWMERVRWRWWRAKRRREKGGGSE